jgi:hypothetical protein
MVSALVCMAQVQARQGMQGMSGDAAGKCSLVQI